MCGEMKSLLVSMAFMFLVSASCSRAEHENRMEGPYPVQIKVEECLEISPGFAYNYENYAGWSTSSSDGNTRLTGRSLGSVFTFDVRTQKLSSVYEVAKKGPSEVGGLSHFDGVVRVGNDELLIAKNQYNQVYLISKDSARIIADFSSSIDIRMASNFSNPPVEAKDYFLFPFYPNRKEKIGNSNAFIAISKDYKKVTEVVDVAPAYRGRFYGTAPYFYFPSVAYNPDKNTYLVSFPISHDVYEYDENFRLINTHQLFHEEVGKIMPYDKPLDEEGNPDFDEDVAYYRSTNHFVNIYYLPKSDQYVRVVRILDIESEKVGGEFMIIVYDGSFSRSKHFMLDEKYFAYGSFATDEQIYFLNQEEVRQ